MKKEIAACLVKQDYHDQNFPAVWKKVDIFYSSKCHS